MTPLEGGALVTPLALAKEVSFLKIADPSGAVPHAFRSEQVAESDFPVSQGESDFLGI
jgi:hypothetical protein